MDSKLLSQIETLRKISFNTIEQFCEDINRNFAVIQNSPLFKGIPGDEGEPGSIGAPGIRGSQFFFVALNNFTANFPGIIKTGSDITLGFLNSNLNTFDSKQKILKSLGTTELVNGDVVVLTNSVMLSYSSSAEIFINTNIAFNEQSNIISSIQDKIDQAVKDAIDNNTIINSLKNIFIDYETVGKQYADTDNSYVSRRSTVNGGRSIGLTPYIPGVNNNIGAEGIDHEYFGYSTNEMNNSTKAGTLVLGSMPLFIRMFNNTITTSGQQTFTARYVPTQDAIPTLVLMQDTGNAGLMLGMKGEENTLKTFASIFKSEDGYLNIKSDMGEIESEYGLLRMNRLQLSFNKDLRIIGNSTFERNVDINGHVDSEFFRTGTFTKSKNKDTFELGQNPVVPKSQGIVYSDEITFTEYKTFVLVADENGKLLKQYTIEKTLPSETTDLGEITNYPDDANTVITSNFFAYLVRKFNSVCKYAVENYWRKNQFNTGKIPSLHLSNDLTVDNNIINPGLEIRRTAHTVEVCNKTDVGWSYENAARNVKFSKFQSKVLVTGTYGSVLQTYSIETVTMKDAELVDDTQITAYPNSSSTVVTGNYLGWVVRKLNNFMKWVGTTYWKKSDFETGDMPKLNIKQFTVTGDFSTPQINASATNNTVSIGKDNNTRVTLNGTATFSKYKSNVLVTDSTGVVLATYSLEKTVLPDNELPGFNLLSENLIVSEQKIPSSLQFSQLIRKINNIISSIKNDYLNKDDYENNVIPNLKVTSTLTAADSIVIGADADNAAFISDRVKDTTVIGTGTQIHKSSNIRYDEFKNKVLVCDASGVVLKTYEIEKVETDTESLNDIPQKYGSVPPITATRPTSDSKILTSKYWNQLYNAIQAIKTRLQNTPNRDDSIRWMYSHLPVGSIQMWSAKSVELLKLTYPDTWRSLLESDQLTPKGWVICDGRQIPGLSIEAPDYRNKYVRGRSNYDNLTEDTKGGSDTFTLEAKNLPKHAHGIDMTSADIRASFPHSHAIYGGEHQHYFFGMQVGNAKAGGSYDNAVGSYDDNGAYRYYRRTSPDYIAADINSGGDGLTPGAAPGQGRHHQHRIGTVPYEKEWTPENASTNRQATIKFESSIGFKSGDILYTKIPGESGWYSWKYTNNVPVEHLPSYCDVFYIMKYKNN